MQGTPRTKQTAGKPRKKRALTGAEKLVTAQQAVAITGIPYGTLRDLHFRGHLPVVKLPDCDRWWFRRDDLDKLIARSLQETA